MAKNKSRNRKQPQVERAAQATRPSGMEPQDEQRAPQVAPGDTVRKRQKRFGHN
ncbi:hypothetical protein [Streptomyces glaucus]|uniref:Small hydrophilic protein n=1 Tax=Streptomyces glaucus TaxID=284029 RepID=A0ABN3JFX7_9ACTN